MTLSYSSGALRGLGNRGATFGSIATGWQFNEVQITRTGSKLKTDGSGYQYPASFRLTINGKGGRLVAGGAGNGGTLYYVEDMPQIRVTNFNGTNYNSGAVNSYWVVQTGDGTSYRLGYTADAVTLHSIKGPASGDTTFSNPEIIIWHLDTVTDAFGNQINYNYVNHQRISAPNPLWLNVRTENKDLAEISYNFPGRITTLPPSATVARLRDTSTAASKVTFAYDANMQLQTIKVYHGGQEVRRYLIQASTIEIQNKEVGGPRCADLDSDGSWGGGTYTRVINSITEQGFDIAGNPVSLPATTFEHQIYRHILWKSTPCILYEYMSAVNNGYGGRIEFQYLSDGRGMWEGPAGYGVLKSAEQYVVNRMIQKDGRNAPVTTEYTYQDRCYDQWGTTCAQPETDDKVEYGIIAGHGQVQVTTQGFNNELLRRTITKYDVNLAKLGRPLSLALSSQKKEILQPICGSNPG